jgi:hypothetical protein
MDCCASLKLDTANYYTDTRDYEPWLGLPTEMLNTYLSCGCCGTELHHMAYYYQAVSYMIHSQEQS